MFYLGIVLVTVGVILLIVSIFLSIVVDESFVCLVFISGGLLFLSPACFRPDAKIDDVYAGKAQQVLYTTYGVTDEGDTISCEKTYKIEWKDEWKYGRKQQ